MRRACAALAIVLLGCGGGPRLTGDVFQHRDVRYRVGELGEGWERLSIPSNDLAWRNADLHAIVQVNGRCDPGNDVPLTSLTNHLLIGFTERDYREQETVRLDGREALRTHVLAQLDGVPRELLFFVLKKNDCTYDFALVTPPGARFEAARPIFEQFVGAFTTEPDGT